MIIRGMVRGLVKSMVAPYFKAVDPYPNSWINSDGSINCSGIFISKGT